MQQPFYYLSLLLVLFMSSCRDPNEVDDGMEMNFQDQMDVADDIYESYESFLIDNSPVQSRQLIVDILRADEDIVAAGLSEDDETVYWTFKDGLEFYFLTETALTLDTTNTRDDNSFNDRTSGRDYSKVIPENKNALVLSPYQYEWGFFDFLFNESEQVAAVLSENNYDVTFKMNESASLGGVTLDDYRGFENFSVIAISSHGGVARDGEIFINTGVEFTEELKEALQVDKENGRIGVAMSIDRNLFSNKKRKVVALKSSWFAHEYRSKLDQTLIHIGACKGYYNESLADALVGSESAFFGWTDNVQADTNTENAINFFKELGIGSTAKQSYDQVVIGGSTTSNRASFMMSYNSFNDLALVDCRLDFPYEYFTDPRDGYTYPTIEIDDQVWFAENLRIEVGSTGEVLGVAYGQEEYDEVYGRRYSLYELDKICPNGWHVPSDEEWSALDNSLGMPPGKDLMDCMLSYGTNRFGLAFLQGGAAGTPYYPYRTIGIGGSAEFWTSTDAGASSSNSWYYLRGIREDGFYKDEGVGGSLICVRCIQD